MSRARGTEPLSYIVPRGTEVHHGYSLRTGNSRLDRFSGGGGGGGGAQTDLIILLLFVINRYIFMLYLCNTDPYCNSAFCCKSMELNDYYYYYYYYYYYCL